MRSGRVTARRRVRAVLATGLVLGVLAGCGTDAIPSEVAAIFEPPVRIEEGLEPQMTPTDVARMVLGLIHDTEQRAGVQVRPARIVSMTATSESGGIVWHVVAEGTFTAHSAPLPPGVVPASTGYYDIHDGDPAGEPAIRAFGYP